MAIYKMLQTGSSGGEVERLQQALVERGYSVGATGVDGIYGKNTAAAVRQYQRDKNLLVDGIAGDETLGSLYGASSSQPTVSAPAELPTYYDPAEDTNYTQALTALETARQNRPVWEDSYSQQLEAVYSRIIGREPFRYDAAGDPLYRQYAQSFTHGGRMAMLDTMGQAAALTGGYGSSYAQVAGQQQYGAYLQKVSDALPQFYGMALDRYTAEGKALEEQYTMLEKQQAEAYSQYQDALSQYWKNVSGYEQQLEDAYDQGYTAWKSQKDAQQTEYSRLVKLITGSGYTPTAAQLQAAGMTRTEANAFARQYKGN